MPAPDITFTDTSNFGCSNGPTFQGRNIVTGGDNSRAYSETILAGVTGQVMDASGFVAADLLAYGFQMTVDPIQSGSPSQAQKDAATVTITFKGCCAGVTDYTITLGSGQKDVATVVPASIVADATSIEVDGDANCDCIIGGALMLAS